MRHCISSDDQVFRQAFETGGIAAGSFDHRSHLRLAYIHLCEAAPAAALPLFRAALQRFLQQVGAPASKYHETLTAAWLHVVWLAMQEARPCESAADFLDAVPALLVRDCLERHYSPAVLASDAARQSFVAPDRAPFAGGSATAAGDV